MARGRRFKKDYLEERERRDLNRSAVGFDEDMMERAEAWREASGNVIGKVASIIAGRTIETRWVENVPIAATDGKDILISSNWFRSKIIPQLMKRDMSSTAKEWGAIKGIAYHELSHILWTPRQNHKPLKDIVRNHEQRSIWNLLEDQRIESLFVARYRPAIPYFTQIVLDYVVANNNKNLPSAQVFSWLLLHGRKYIDPEIREHYRQQADKAIRSISSSSFYADIVENGASNFLAPLIDEYRALTFPADGERAVEIIDNIATFLEYTGLFPSIDPLIEDYQNGHGEHVTGRSVPVAEERKDRDRMVEAESKEPEASSEPQTEGNQVNGGGSEAATGEDDKNIGAKIREELGKAQEVVEDEGMDMVKTISKIVRDTHVSTVPGVNDTAGISSRSLTPYMEVDSQRLAREIGLVFSDHEDCWVRGNSSGRLNVTDVMSARGRHFNVFDSWQEADEDDLSFEIVILFDRSTSMAGQTNDSASQCMWTVQRAFESLDIPTTVIGYSNGASMLSHRNSFVERSVYNVPPVIGGTDPNEALEWAKSIFRNSTANHKIIVSITDGYWWGCGDGESAIIRRMIELHSLGCQSLLVTIDGECEHYAGLYNGHKEHVALTSQTLRRLPLEVGKRVAKLAAETIQQTAA